MIIYYFLIQKLVCKTNFKYKKENKKLGRHFLSQEKNVQNTTEKNLEIENIVPCYTLNCSELNFRSVFTLVLPFVFFCQIIEAI